MERFHCHKNAIIKKSVKERMAGATGSVPVAGSKERLMRKHLSTILLILVFAIGLCLLLYPTVSDYWNSFHQSRAIADYVEQVTNIDNETYDEILREAASYNETLKGRANRFVMDDGEREQYEKQLDISGVGIMGYLEIPSIDVSLAVYHGTAESVLQVGVGHLEGTSLPVGGEGTHCVLSGHRGLPSARLFTDLDKMVVGDLFVLRILDETLTYEVDQILIVEPADLSGLEIQEGEDYCTLVTCTPYGINSHRILVRGHRVENQRQPSNVRVTADAMQIDPVVVAPAVAAPILLLLLVWLLVKYRKH